MDEREKRANETVMEWHRRLQAANNARDMLKVVREGVSDPKSLPPPTSRPQARLSGKAGGILQTLLPDEPVFIIRGKDILALMAIHHYTSLIEMYTPYDQDQLQGMAAVAERFRQWQRAHPESIKLPD